MRKRLWSKNAPDQFAGYFQNDGPHEHQCPACHLMARCANRNCRIMEHPLCAVCYVKAAEVAPASDNVNRQYLSRILA